MLLSTYPLRDFARVQPPEAPMVNYPGNSVFYNLLRPEFLKKYPKPLCSDAFSGWIANDPNRKQLNADVEEATAYLFKVVIPEFAKKMEENYEMFGDIIFNEELFIKNGKPISTTLLPITSDTYHLKILQAKIHKYVILRRPSPPFTLFSAILRRFPSFTSGASQKNVNWVVKLICLGLVLAFATWELSGHISPQNQKPEEICSL